MTFIFITKNTKDTDLAIKKAYLLFCQLIQFPFKHSEPIVFRIKGKPGVKGFKGHVSASHSGDFLIVAISLHDIGIDIEKIRDVDYEKISARFFNNSSKTLNEFFTHWCAAEAVAKGTGKPLIKCLRNNLDGESLFFLDFISGYVFCCYSSMPPLIHFEN